MPLPPGPSSHRVVQSLRFIRNPVNFMESCRKRFGETFMATLAGGQSLVFTSEPEAIKGIFSEPRNEPGDSRRELLEPIMGPRSLFFARGEEHLRKRRLMLPPLHRDRIGAHAQLIEQLTLAELESWPVGEPFPVHPRMLALTLEIILRTVFGLQEGERLDRLRELLAEAFTIPDERGSIVWATLTRRLGQFRGGERFDELMAEADALIAEEISSSRSDPALAERDDTLALLIQSRYEDGTGMDDGELRDQLITLLHAGHAPSSAGLSWAFDLVLRAERPERLGELAQDADHMRAVVRETLRVRPVILGAARELASPLKINGYQLPPGSKVMAAIYMAHTRPDLYPRPQEFQPERFLTEAPETYTWIPFGGGTRRCIGASFAELEMTVILRTVLGNAKLRAATRRPERPVIQNVLSTPAKGAPVVLEGRR